MRIEEIRVRKAGIQSSIRNAVISFSEMTLSVVRIRFDHGGKPWMVMDFVPMADTRRVKSSNIVLSQESSPPIQTICLTNQDCLIPSKSGML